jgi:hypothetical protein
MFRLEFAFGFDFLTFFFITIRFQNVIFITFEQNLTGLVS